MVFVLTFFLIVWGFFGKDPKEGAIVPEYHPPPGLSPAAVRFISRMGYDDKAFGSAVINMAVHGALSIREDKGSYTLEKNQDHLQELFPEERTVLVDLFGAGPTLSLSSYNHEQIGKAVSGLREALRRNVENTYFVTNRMFFFMGLALSMAALVVSSYYNESLNVLIVPGALLYSILPLVFLTALRKTVSNRREETLKKGLLSDIGVLWYSGKTVFYAILLIAVLGAGLFGLTSKTSPLYALSFFGILALDYLFYYLLKAPTPEGRLAMNRIKGFRMFLSATEEDRLNRMDSPDRTPELFERYLPYALALDVEKAWASQFSDLLSKAGYSPGWYGGTWWESGRVTAFSSSLAGSFAGAISSSSTPPGSRSGSSSGSSGGGGGGGGGGGW